MTARCLRNLHGDPSSTVLPSTGALPIVVNVILTPMKTNMILTITWENHPCSIGNTSSNDGFFIVMLVFGGIQKNKTLVTPAAYP